MLEWACLCLIALVTIFYVYRIGSWINTGKGKPVSVELEDLADAKLLMEDYMEEETKVKESIRYYLHKSIFGVQIFLCITLSICATIKSFFTGSSFDYIETVCAWIMWSVMLFIFLNSDIDILRNGESFSKKFLSVFHLGRIRENNKENSSSNVKRNKYRHSSILLHAVILVWLFTLILWMVLDCSMDFYEYYASGYTETTSVDSYILGLESIFSVLLWISLIGSNFSFSKIFYFLIRDKEMLQYLDEVETKAENSSLMVKDDDGDDDSQAEDDSELDKVKNGFIHNCRRLLQEVSPDLGYLIPATIFVIIEALCAVLNSTLIGVCISIFTPNVNGTYGLAFLGQSEPSEYDDSDSETFQQSQFYHLVQVACLLIGVMTIECICAGLTNALVELASERMAARVRSKTLYSLLGQELGHFDEVMSGDIWSRLTNDTNEMKKAMNCIGLIVYCSIVCLIGLCILFVISWKLTLTLICVLPILGIGMGIQSSLVSKYTTMKLNRLAKAGQAAEEILANIKIVKSSSTEQKEARRYGSRIFNAFQIAKKTAIVEGIANGGIFLMFNVSVVVAIIMAGYLVLSEQVTTGEVVIYLIFIMDIMMYFSMIPDNISQFSKSVGASDSLFSIIDRKPKITENGILDAKSTSCNVEFNDVSFEYPTRKQLILNNVSFQIPNQNAVGLIGPSGSGKSTILSLLMRFYEPTKGIITIGGHDIKEFDIKSLRANIALVLQDSMLFTDTVANNISYGFSKPDMNRVIEAAKAANAHEFIMSLPKKYNTIISKSTLSGGQRQRISVARAIYKDPQIVLLDEYTSGFDKENQDIVIESISRLTQDKTVVIISHSKASIKHADSILVLNGGEITKRKDWAEARLIASSKDSSITEIDDEEEIEDDILV